MQKDFRRQARWAKMNYKEKVERKLTSGNARQAWQGLNTMMGRKPKPEVVDCPDPASLAEQLNNLFTRFNSNSTTCTWTPETHHTSLQPIIVSEQLVTSSSAQRGAHQAVPAPLGLRHSTRAVEGIYHHSTSKKGQAQGSAGLRTSCPDINPMQVHGKSCG